MRRWGKNKGVCGRGGKLTFEHVPPKAPHNETDMELFGIDNWLNRKNAGEMTGGHSQPEGTGAISICKQCNENTGSWYMLDFAKLAQAGVQLHHQLQDHLSDDPDDSRDAKVVGITIGKGSQSLAGDSMSRRSIRFSISRSWVFVLLFHSITST